MRTSRCNYLAKGLSCFNSQKLIVSRSAVLSKSLFLKQNVLPTNCEQLRWKSGKDDLSSIVIPVPIKPANNVDDINIGEQISGPINKRDILRVINEFLKDPDIATLAADNGLDSKLFYKAAVSFRNFCMDSKTLPPVLHVTFSNILQRKQEEADNKQDENNTREYNTYSPQQEGHIHSLFPFFLNHAKETFPHLGCLDVLKKISDLRHPSTWYEAARKMNRKLIFHAGPTNSGKTYEALEKFVNAESGVYCGPLKLLSVEVCNKTNERKPCDLVTGEERKSASIAFPQYKDITSKHVACTIEMVSVENTYDVAVIDEIQMIKDPGRGWAWTRALLGLAAKEIYVCGEASAIDLVREIASSCGEELEVHHHERLTSLTVEDKALRDLSNIQPGDCIVCFSKNDIFNVSMELERKGFECAVIYGGLPPGTKIAQSKKFNDPNHSCKILVATDAIGMGLNLSIRRVIFYSLLKPVMNEKGEKEIDTISTSQALQIAGRAGRYKTEYEHGFVTTFRSEDLPILKNILSKSIESIQRAGLHPTADQMEMFAYHLPDASMSNLIDIFVSLSVMDASSYFMCDTEGFKFLADMIEHVELPLRVRYVFCCAPINKKQPFVCSMFLKFSKQYAQNDPLTVEKLCRTIGWPFAEPKNVTDLVHQEAVFDVLDLYLWLSYRFPDLFPDQEPVRSIQHQLDKNIQLGVSDIIHLLNASEADALEEEESNGDWKKNNKRSSMLRTDTNQKESMKNIGQGQLTEQLLAKGLITPEMLKTLQKEWQDSLDETPLPFNPFRPRKSKVYTRRTKTK